MREEENDCARKKEMEKVDPAEIMRNEVHTHTHKKRGNIWEGWISILFMKGNAVNIFDLLSFISFAVFYFFFFPLRK